MAKQLVNDEVEVDRCPAMRAPLVYRRLVAAALEATP
jgi:hypothetical protein